MIQRVTVAPEYSMLFISGSDHPETPFIPQVQELTIWSTETCIAFGCLMYQDGDTEVTLAPAAELLVDSVLRPDCVLRFDGELETPVRRLDIATAGGEIVLQSEVQTALTRVQIWSDHPKEPEHVFIGLG